MVKNPLANAGDIRDLSLIRVRKILWSRKWQPAPVILPGKFHGQRSLASYSPWVRKDLDRTEHAHTCIECGTLTVSSCRILNRSTGIPSPPLALLVVKLPKAHLTSHSRMSGSRKSLKGLISAWRLFLTIFPEVRTIHPSLRGYADSIILFITGSKSMYLNIYMAVCTIF